LNDWVASCSFGDKVNTVLEGYNDWAHIVYNFRDTPGHEDGFFGFALPEMTQETYTALKATKVVELPENIFVVPEYTLGALLSLAACFAAFVAIKKPHLNLRVKSRALKRLLSRSLLKTSYKV
jgi:hypothetical protein